MMMVVDREDNFEVFLYYKIKNQTRYVKFDYDDDKNIVDSFVDRLDMDFMPIETAPKDGTWILMLFYSYINDVKLPLIVARFHEGMWVRENGETIREGDFWAHLPSDDLNLLKAGD